MKDFTISPTKVYKFTFSLVGIMLLCFALILLFTHLNSLLSFGDNPVGNSIVVVVSTLFIFLSLFLFAQGYYQNIQLQKDTLIEKRGFLFAKVIDTNIIDHINRHTSYVNSDSSESDVKSLQIFDKDNNLIQEINIGPYSNSDIEQLVKLLIHKKHIN
ncbi:MAG TPA: hypothetical protein VLF93_02495 [Candidatus Saccharimonadales bacterium]|nr:hypothetical protein [Candidatus Saccharimonadales bacterium]